MPWYSIIPLATEGAYGGTGTCAASGMISALSATGAATCISSTTQLTNLNLGRIATSGVGAYMQITGGNLTVSSTLPSSSVSFNFPISTTTAPYSYAAQYNETVKNIGWIDCTEAAANATDTISVGYATTSVKAVVGTIGAFILSNFTCGSVQDQTTTFTNSSIPIGSWIITEVSSTVGSPTNFLLDIYLH